MSIENVLKIDMVIIKSIFFSFSVKVYLILQEHFNWKLLISSKKNTLYIWFCLCMHLELQADSWNSGLTVTWVRYTVHWATRQWEGDRLRKTQLFLKVLKSMLVFRQHAYACQHLAYRAKTPNIPCNITALSLFPFNMMKECFNTNVKSMPSSALLPVFAAEGS